MKVVLIHPPWASHFSPPHGIIALGSHLSASRPGIRVQLFDASIDALHHLLSRDYLKPALENSLRFLSEPDRHHLRQRLQAHRPGNGAADGSLPDPTDLADRAAALRADGAFRFGPAQFSDAIPLLNDALLYSHATAFPTVLSFASFTGRAELLRTESQNPFLSYYRSDLIPSVQAFQADLIGISLNYPGQLFPALSLIDELKARLETPIVCGGSLISTYFQDLEMSWEENGWVDEELRDDSSLAVKLLHACSAPFSIPGEGEEPLGVLCDCLAGNGDLGRVPNLIRKLGNTLRFHRQEPPLKARALPSLELQGLPVSGRYVTPFPLAPLMSSRGCYWQKCSFCQHYGTLTGDFRQLPVDKVVKTLKTYEAAGIRFAMFCDEGMSPAMLRRLSERLFADEPGILWGTMIRFEEGLKGRIAPAAKVGLRYLSFGLESGCQRVVSLMRKGFSLELAGQILDQCFENGVLVQLHIMFGFPTETRAEAEETIAFLEKNAEKILCVRANPWYFKKRTPIGRNPKAFGLDRNSPLPPDQVGQEEAARFVTRLQNHPVLGPKMVSHYPEDFFIIRSLAETAGG